MNENTIDPRDGTDLYGNKPTKAPELTGESAPVEESPAVTETSQMEEVRGGVVESVSHQHQISNFVDENPVPRYNPLTLMKADVDMGMLDSAIQDFQVHSTNAVISRVIQLGAATWTPTTTAFSDCLDVINSSNLNSPLFNIQCPIDIIKGGVNASTMVWEKINGFSAMRCATVIRIVVNAQKFQAGILRVVAFPYPELLGNRNIAAFQNGISASQLPHAQLDISKERSVDLRLPWLGPALFHDITLGKPTVWGVYVYPFSKLSDSANVGVRVTAFGMLEDVELRHPTPIVAANKPAEAMRVFKSKRPKKYLMAIGDEAKTMSSSGDISGPATTIANVAGTLAMVPGLSQFAGPIATVAGGAAGIARALGHSKPQSVEIPNPTELKQGGYILTGDGCETAHEISMNTSNSVSNILDGHSLTRHDELHFNHIIGKPTLFKKIIWATTNTEDEPLDEQIICPIVFQRLVQGTNGTTYAAQTPLAHVAGMFGLWRGSIKLKFTVVKTTFHSGVLRLSHFMFAPYVTPPIIDLNRAPAVIWNIDDSSTMEYVIPFGSIWQWKKNSRLLDYVDASGVIAEVEDSVGTFVIAVQNPLVAASAVANQVEILMEVSGCEDMQFAIPRAPELQPQFGTIPQGTKSYSMAVGSTSRLAQTSGGNREPTGGGYMTYRSTTAESTTVGETIVSFRPMLKRYMPYNFIQLGTNAITNIRTDALIQPIGMARLHPDPTLTVYDDVYETDWVASVSYLFAFRTGGTFLKMFPEQVKEDATTPPHGDVCSAITVYPISQQSVQFNTAIEEIDGKENVEIYEPGSPAGKIINQETTGLMPIFTPIEGFATINCPYYAKAHTLLNELYNGEFEKSPMDKKFIYEDCIPNMMLRVEGPLTYEVSVTILRAARDDFNLSFFLGVPGVMRYYVKQQAIPESQLYEAKNVTKVRDGKFSRLVKTNPTSQLSLRTARIAYTPKIERLRVTVNGNQFAPRRRGEDAADGPDGGATDDVDGDPSVGYNYPCNQGKWSNISLSEEVNDEV